MAGKFVWDERKAESNAHKHGVTFDEARTAFADREAMTRHDPDHSSAEDRFVTMGISGQGRLLVVVHVDSGDDVRLISARKATKAEAKHYAKSQTNR